MKTFNDYIQLYTVWVNGRDINDNDQHFPVNSTIELKEWHNDLKEAIKDYYNAKVYNNASEYGFYNEIYKDYVVTLFSIEVNIPKFEKQYRMKFDLTNDICLESLSYFVDYNFNTVAERVSKFNYKKSK